MEWLKAAATPITWSLGVIAVFQYFYRKLSAF
jgi:hypothetical protein